jgi:hypothetical protein
MLRGPFPGHRRYSITHRAVQRLRELVPTMDDLDDEGLRDRLDMALSKAEDGGKAVRTLDAMLGEPQVLIPVEEFGEVLYAIIKEDTVVTVLPRGHGEEILQRGQALQQRLASGELQIPDRGEATGDRWDTRRRWRREAPGPVVIERPRPMVVRGEPESPPPIAPAFVEPAAPVVSRPPPEAAWTSHAPTAERPDDPIGAALWDALERGSRRATVHALTELLGRKDRDDDLLPVWNEIAALGIPHGLKLGDLIDACRQTR